MKATEMVIDRKGDLQAVAAEPNKLVRAFDLCVRKARGNIKRLADKPKAAPWALNGDYFAHKEGFYEIGNWTSSFFTGMALLAWRQTEDEYFIQQVQRLSPHYMAKAFKEHRDTHHDIGFLYSLYSVALYKLTGDPVQRETGLRAATVLARRFNPTGNFIRAWGRLDETISPVGPAGVQTDNLAIIDCLMNLPLLYWATEQTGNQQFRNIAERHANTVLEHFVRPDDSVCHSFRFDLQTGAPIGPENFCGSSKDSYWARGAAWAIYGFALSYSYTRDEKYLFAAMRLTKKFIAQLDTEVVPVWDFRLPVEAEPVRDTSAAVIAVCGFQELAKHHVANFEMARIKQTLLDRICTEDYLDFNEACPGVLKSAYGDKPAYSSWGDYFLMEALDRELHQNLAWW